MKIKAYPKVNLCLKVYKGLSEGKHKIDSVMVLNKKIHDTIYIFKSDSLFVSYREGRKEISLSDCLVTKAMKYLYNQHNIDVNYKIKIIKRIPYAAGLGGGSADAAAVMNYVLSLNPNTLLDLKEIALELGSDIPFLLSGLDIARVKEHGEYVTPIYNWKPQYKLHFNKVICSTTKVFTSLSEDDEYQSRVNVDSFIEKHLYKQHLRNVVYNDLTKYIIQNYTELQDVYKKSPNNSFFTGAGSTIVTLKD